MSATATRRETARALLDTHGQTYAAQAGIRLRDTPQPLYQLLVLASLLSARIRASVAVGAAHELFEADMRTPAGCRTPPGSSVWTHWAPATTGGTTRARPPPSARARNFSTSTTAAT